MRGTVFVNVERCLACKRCMLECAVTHSRAGNFLEAMTETPVPRPRVSLHPMGEFAVPLQCRHCENAQCIAVCPTGAMHRLGKEGPVLIDERLCVGCRSCVVACHFGVPVMSRDGKRIYKCDQCIGRLDEGMKPACVTACHTDALTFVTVEEMQGRFTTPLWRLGPDAPAGRKED